MYVQHVDLRIISLVLLITYEKKMTNQLFFCQNSSVENKEYFRQKIIILQTAFFFYLTVRLILFHYLQ